MIHAAVVVTLLLWKVLRVLPWWVTVITAAVFLALVVEFWREFTAVILLIVGASFLQRGVRRLSRWRGATLRRVAGRLPLAAGTLVALRWRHIAVASGLSRTDSRGVVVVPRAKVRRTLIGYRLAVQPVLGSGVDDVMRQSDEIAAGFGCPVRIDRGPAETAVVRLISRDVLADVREFMDAALVPVASSLARVPIGWTEEDQGWEIPLDGGSIVLGGEPGGGKSGILTALLCAVAPRADVQIVAIDLKGMVEFSDYTPRCSAVAGDQSSAADVLLQVEAIREARMNVLRSKGLTSMTRHGYTADLPLLVVAIDEAAELFSAESADRADKDRAAGLVRLTSRLVRLGRAAGVVLVLATQKPTADALPSQVRDAARTKVATRVVTREQERAVLGDAGAESQVSALRIPLGRPGTAVTDTGAGLAFVRSAFIGEEIRRQVVAQTAHLRRELDDLIPEPEWEKAV